MSQSDNEPNDQRQRKNEAGRPDQSDRQQDDSVDSATEWFASTAVRAGLTVIGLVLLLFALGQAVGLPLLELVASALTSQTGQWLVVAFFAVLLIGAAQKGIPTN
jgi:hypothetical protein